MKRTKEAQPAKTIYSGITELNTSNIENFPASEILISPIPFDESLVIDTKTNVEKYEIIDEMGRTLIHETFEKNLHLNLPSGLYFLKLINKNKRFTVHKIIRR